MYCTTSAVYSLLPPPPSSPPPPSPPPPPIPPLPSSPPSPLLFLLFLLLLLHLLFLFLLLHLLFLLLLLHLLFLFLLLPVACSTSATGCPPWCLRRLRAPSTWRPSGETGWAIGKTSCRGGGGRRGGGGSCSTTSTQCTPRACPSMPPSGCRHPTNITSVHLVMDCPNTRAGEKKDP